jgi:hypothetical protein
MAKDDLPLPLLKRTKQRGELPEEFSDYSQSDQQAFTCRSHHLYLSRAKVLIPDPGVGMKPDLETVRSLPR